MYLPEDNTGKFRDTVITTDEVPIETEGMYSDPTTVGEIEKEISEGIKDETSVKYATFIRQKMFGVDVRESMARFVLWISVLYNRLKIGFDNIVNKFTDIEGKFAELNDKFDNQLAGNTEDGEVIGARKSKHDGKTYKILGDRLDAMDESHYTIPLSEAVTLRTLQDDRFSVNHEFLLEATVASDSDKPGLVIAEIGNATQKTFSFEKVGSI